MYSGHQPRQSTKDAPHGRRCIGRCRSVRQPEPGVRRKQRPPPANQQRDLGRKSSGAVPVPWCGSLHCCWQLEASIQRPP
eukprot:jgi/Botrbrau1/8742/Bobra.0090s0016.2